MAKIIETENTLAVPAEVMADTITAYRLGCGCCVLLASVRLDEEGKITDCLAAVQFNADAIPSLIATLMEYTGGREPPDRSKAN